MHIFKQSLLALVSFVIVGGAVFYGTVLNAQQQSYDVVLTTQTPLYTWRQIPYNNSTGYFPFTNIEWVQNGFVVAGNCADGRNGTQLESAGMYLFSESGVHQGTQNVCSDTTTRAQGCYEAGGCSAGTKILPFSSGGSFVREMQTTGHGFARSPVSYSASGGLSMLSRVFFNTMGFGWHGGNDIGLGNTSLLNNLAVANGILVGTEDVYRGTGDQYDEFNSFYSLPALNRIARVSRGYYPIVGIGEYFIALPGRNSLAGARVYRMPSQTELSQGQLPTQVQTLPSGAVINYALDARDPNRIAIYWDRGTLRTYTTGTNGLVEESERRINPFEAGNTHTHFVAIMGDYTAYPKCTGSGLTNQQCELIVENGTSTLSVQPLPRSVSDEKQRIMSLAFSPSGKILVALQSPGGSENGELYMYQVGGVQNVPSGGTTTPGTLPEVDTDAIMRAFVDIGFSYARYLQGFLNHGFFQPTPELD